MRTRIILVAALWVVSGCGDTARHGGSDGFGGDGTGGAGSGATGTTEPVGVGSGNPSSNDATTTTTGTGMTGSASCAEIWDCYQGCHDTQCTGDCFDMGTADAKKADEALWECIFTHECSWECALAQGCQNDPCVQQNCSAESNACLGGG